MVISGRDIDMKAWENSRVLEMFYIFTWMVFIQEYTYVKKQDIHLMLVYFTSIF